MRSEPGCISGASNTPSSSASPEYSPYEDSESEDEGCNFHTKPTPPYKVDFRFTAVSHDPTSSIGICDATTVHTYWYDNATQRQAESCPTDFVENANPGVQTEKDLHITSLIRVGNNCGAQLVVVNGDKVAKIYDPLFYAEYDDGFKQDVNRRARNDYIQESAAYNQIEKSTDAARGVTPRFHGAWSTKIATTVEGAGSQEKQTRTVYLILIQLIRGECMGFIKPRKLRKYVRSRALKKVLDAEAVLFEAGIRHCDFHPLNVILDIPAGEDPEIKAYIIDFNFCELFDLGEVGEWLDQLKAKWPKRLCSPLIRNYGSMMDFAAYGWCSSEDTEADKWLWRHYKNDPRYFPVTWNLEKPYDEPDYEEPSGMAE